MADSKISQLTSLTTPHNGDYLVIVDNSSTATDKKITVGSIFATTGPYLLVASSTSPLATQAKADYVCDGTADDVQINAALVALGSGGGTVYLTAGTYNLSATLTFLVPYTQLIGSGWGTILMVNNSTNIYAITYGPSSSVRMDGCVVRDLTILCNGANQSSAGGGIYAYGSAFNEFDHLYIDSPWNNGIYCYTDNLGGYGHHNNISRCTFLNGQNTNGGDGRGVLLENSDENIVLGCIFQDNGRAAASEPNHAFDKAGLNCFIGNQFVSGQTGLKFNSSHSRAIGNTFDGCQNEQMRVNGDRNQIIGNNFYNIGFNGSANSNDGLWVDNVQYTTVVGNVFMPLTNTANARSGINISSGPSQNSLIENNTFTLNGSGTAVWQTAAIVLGSGTANIVRNNQGFVTENAGLGTVVSGSTAVNITHGAAYTPGLNEITISSISNLGSATKIWVSNPGTAQFTVNTDVNPGGSTAIFAWNLHRN